MPGQLEVELHNVSKTYFMDSVEIRALRGVNLGIEHGEVVVILAPSGSGKTTMLNLIGGLDSPTEGKVIVGGEDISRYDEDRLTEYRRRHIGFIFQFYNLIPTLTDRENAEFSLELVKQGAEEVERRAQELLEGVGLGERADHFPNQLSGGEQQRVAIARALAKNPPVMLCDEPTGDLDSKTGASILKLMRELNRKQGTVFIIITHNSPIAQIADRVIKLSNGQIKEITFNPFPLDPEKVSW
jgi:putative ABC transport system ATP-binding protein